MDQGDLCLCVHTREEHFGRTCSRVNCRCKQFVLIDFAPALFYLLTSIVPSFEMRLTAKPKDVEAWDLLNTAKELLSKARNQ